MERSTPFARRLWPSSLRRTKAGRRLAQPRLDPARTGCTPVPWWKGMFTWRPCQSLAAAVARGYLCSSCGGETAMCRTEPVSSWRSGPSPVLSAVKFSGGHRAVVAWGRSWRWLA